MLARILLPLASASSTPSRSYRAPVWHSYALNGPPSTSRSPVTQVDDRNGMSAQPAVAAVASQQKGTRKVGVRISSFLSLEHKPWALRPPAAREPTCTGHAILNPR